MLNVEPVTYLLICCICGFIIGIIRLFNNDWWGLLWIIISIISGYLFHQSKK